MDLSEDISRGEMCRAGRPGAGADHRLQQLSPSGQTISSDTSKDYIVKAYELGIVEGYPDGTFRPNEPLSRQEFFQIMENFCKARRLPARGRQQATLKNSTTAATWPNGRKRLRKSASSTALSTAEA